MIHGGWIRRLSPPSRVLHLLVPHKIRYAALRGITALEWGTIIAHAIARKAEDYSQFMSATSGMSCVPQSGAYHPFLTHW